MSEDGQAFVSNSLGLSEEVSHDLYLGLHSFMGRNRRKLFDSMKERVWKKLQVWWSKLFSFGGREILIKAVAQTTSTYAMSVFKFRQPFLMLFNLSSLIFGGGGEGKDRKIHWASWEKLCWE